MIYQQPIRETISQIVRIGCMVLVAWWVHTDQVSVGEYIFFVQLAGRANDPLYVFLGFQSEVHDDARSDPPARADHRRSISGSSKPGTSRAPDALARSQAPGAENPSLARPVCDLRAAHEQPPHEAAAEILDHDDDRPLVDREIGFRDPVLLRAEGVPEPVFAPEPPAQRRCEIAKRRACSPPACRERTRAPRSAR